MTFQVPIMSNVLREVVVVSWYSGFFEDELAAWTSLLLSMLLVHCFERGTSRQPWHYVRFGETVVHHVMNTNGLHKHNATYAFN